VISELLSFSVHSLRKETMNKVGSMNTSREFEPVKEGNSTFSLTGKWANRNERSKIRKRKKLASRSPRAGLQVARLLVFFIIVFGRVAGIYAL
jgi:hypothetical protein